MQYLWKELKMCFTLLQNHQQTSTGFTIKKLWAVPQKLQPT